MNDKMTKFKNRNEENANRSRAKFKQLSRLYADWYMDGEKKEQYERPEAITWDTFRKYFDVAWEKLQKKAFELVPIEEYSREEWTELVYELRLRNQTNTTLEFISKLEYHPEKYREYFEHPYFFKKLPYGGVDICEDTMLSTRDMEITMRGAQLTEWFSTVLSDISGVDFDKTTLKMVRDDIEEESFFRNPKGEIRQQRPVSIDKARLFWCEYLIWNSQIEKEKLLVKEMDTYLMSAAEEKFPKTQIAKCKDFSELISVKQRDMLQGKCASSEEAYQKAGGTTEKYKRCRDFFQILCAAGISRWESEKRPLTWAVILAVVGDKKIKIDVPRDVRRYGKVIKNKTENEVRSGGGVRKESTKYSAAQITKNITENYQRHDTLIVEPFGQELVELNTYMDAIKIELTCDKETRENIWNMYFYIKECLEKTLLIYDEARFRELVEWIGEGFYGENWL